MSEVNVNVKLLSHTPNPEELIAMAAKMCYSPCSVDKLQEKIESNDQTNFINKLMDMGHESPLEHVSFTFVIEGVSRALLAQITRHRIASFSVRSQRYVNEGEFNYIIPQRIKDLGEQYIEDYEMDMFQIEQLYNKWHKRLTEAGYIEKEANEDARSLLPQACETKFIVTMNTRELLHYFGLRTCKRTQEEHRVLACKMLRLVKEVAPTIFKNAGASCLSGKCSEGSMSCGKPYKKGE